MIRFLRRGAALALAALMLLLCLAGCGGSSPAPSAGEEDAPLKVVCTVFPLYDWARQVIGDAEGVELTLLLEGGTDLHSYQPTAQDMLTISGADLFFYVGGASDSWVEEVLAQTPREGRAELSAMELLKDSLLLTEEQGALHIHNKTHDHSHPHGDDHPMEEYDEHVWLSVKNARSLCAALAQELARLDGPNGGLYEENAAAYGQQLLELDGRFEDTVAAAPGKSILVGDRFPFAYLARDYGLTCYAAFSGCSSESEASFETVAFLASTLEEKALPAVLVLENSDGKLARTIVENTSRPDCPVLELNSLQSVNNTQMEEGATYLSLMEGNLEALARALG